MSLAQSLIVMRTGLESYLDQLPVGTKKAIILLHT